MRKRSFNRTFMELKFNRAYEIIIHKDSFNRTFMELKYRWLFGEEIEGSF